MALGILHISDLHCKNNASKYNEKIKKAAEALRTVGHIDRLVIIISGDIVDEPKNECYREARKIISQLLSNVKRELGREWINIYLVPGNHDINIKDNP